jgi:hypothetical protein
MRTPRTAHILGLTLLASALSLPSYAGGDSRPRCDLSSIKGDYGFTDSGTMLGESFADVGRETSDGKGNLRGSATQNVAGAVQTVTFTGRYRVNSDCTGTATLTSVSGRTATRAFVIVDNCVEVDYLFTDAGIVGSGVAKKQNHKQGCKSGNDGDDDDDDDDHDDDDHDDDDGGHGHGHGGHAQRPQRRP